jgi:hypothetical protein
MKSKADAPPALSATATDKFDLAETLRLLATANQLHPLRAPSGDAMSREGVVNRTGSAVTHWFDRQPARDLLSYLQPMRAALEVSGVEAADALLAPLVEENCASLLVLYPQRPAERLSDYALAAQKSLCGWGIERDWSAADRQRVVPVLTLARPGVRPTGGVRLNLAPTTAAEAAKGATGELWRYWVDQLKAGKVDRLDRPPGLPAGAVLGVLEADVARLWPGLSKVAESRLQPESVTSIDAGRYWMARA